MKQILTLLLIISVFQACQSTTGSGDKTSETKKQDMQIAPENLVSKSFNVEGMTCTGCENTVIRSLESMAGVVEVEASHETGETTVQFDESQVTPEALESGIVSAGYRVNSQNELE